MATFGKNQSYKDQRLYIAGAYPQTGNHKNSGEPMTGYNLHVAIANDGREPEDVITNPNLHYGSYQDKDNKPQPTYTAAYSKKQHDAIMETANLDGDKPVINADVFPNPNDTGTIINTKKMSTPEEGFSYDMHNEATNAQREVKKEAREAKEVQEAAESESQDNEPSKEDEGLAK